MNALEYYNPDLLKCECGGIISREACCHAPEPRHGDWIQTYTGRQFWPLDPRPEEVCLEDIAHSLSMMCRYTGHSRIFYSVAEHCCHLYDHASTENKTWALMHDASEAYLVDVARPVKPFLTGYVEIERLVMIAVCQHFNMPLIEPSEVKELDMRILHDESARLMAPPPVQWNLPGKPLGVTIEGWSPERAKAEFLKRARSAKLEQPK